MDTWCDGVYVPVVPTSTIRTRQVTHTRILRTQNGRRYSLIVLVEGTLLRAGAYEFIALLLYIAN